MLKTILAVELHQMLLVSSDHDLNLFKCLDRDIQNIFVTAHVTVLSTFQLTVSHCNTYLLYSSTNSLEDRLLDHTFSSA